MAESWKDLDPSVNYRLPFHHQSGNELDLSGSDDDSTTKIISYIGRAPFRFLR